MNSVNLFGYLDSEPELRGLPGRDLCEFWLAVPGRLDKHIAYIRIFALKGLAERLAREFSEGDWVAISGHLRSERWPGARRLYRHTVLAREVHAATETGSSSEQVS